MAGIASDPTYFCQKWGLTLLEPAYPRSYHWVCPVKGPAGEDWVLKLRPPDRDGLLEIQTLRDYASRGAVRLIDADLERGALLLARIEPGTVLTEVLLRGDESTAIEQAAQTMCRLWQSLPSGQPSLREIWQELQARTSSPHPLSPRSENRESIRTPSGLTAAR